ncbi:type VI secretion system protein ImpG [Janthinobacterium sp. 35]|uniref:type VI secretion system baseplate subunit TssF n=1 Tax=Janthinobacterium sp. 35 TaxID=2035210 RepID=UPI000C47DF3A|nr:type VI secretion system baseplate subunit TssF [Janthinobacterium sp. 35]PIG26085.1 type VI secretion system protein ImpG [Janthinobacterium sp. 35]
MESLLKYYELELGMLRTHQQEFAARYPGVAGALGLTGNSCQDPHIERLIEAYALCNARTAKKIDDARHVFTESMLEVNFPHYLRPFPACSIAHVDASGVPGQARDGIDILPRGTLMHAPPYQGVVCKFRTAYDVVLAPLSLAGARFVPVMDVAAAVNLPSDISTAIAIDIVSTSATGTLEQLRLPAVRVFIDGTPSLTATLRDALFLHAAHAWIEAGGVQLPLAQVPLRAVGFLPEEALLPRKPGSHRAYCLLTEYFAFPEKFQFFDIDLGQITPLLPPGCQRWTLHLGLRDMTASSAGARLLRSVSASNLLLACTPVINLFQQAAAPIRLTQMHSEYPLLAEHKYAHAYDIHSVDAVRLVRQGAHAGTVTHCQPFYAMRHGQAGGAQSRYWVARRDEARALSHPGYESSLAFVDGDEDDTYAGITTVSVDLTCSNRHLPSALPVGAPDGDLRHEGPAGALPVRLLRQPSPAYRFKADLPAQARLLALLSLNHQSLQEDGLALFQEMLALHDLPASLMSQRQIQGIQALTQRASSTWMPDASGGVLVFGIDVLLSVDEEAYVGSGLHVFAQVIEHVLGMYVHVNSYCRLVVISHKSGKELLRCPPRNGQHALA